MSFRNGAKAWFDFRSSRIPRSLFGALILTLPMACTGTILDLNAPDDELGESRPGDRNGGNGGRTIPEDGYYAEACDDERIPARVWRLSFDQLKKSTASAFGFEGLDAKVPADSIDGKTGFNNGDNTYVGDALSAYLYAESEKVAEKFGDNLSNQFSCLSGSSVQDSCVRDFVDTVGRRAFRRKLSDDESTRYVGLFKKTQGQNDARIAAQTVAQAMFLSPNFLYRSEIGNQDGRLEGWEIASVLSYAFTDGPPSDDLLALAESGALDDAGERERVAYDLAALPEAGEKMARFMYWQMKLHRLDNQESVLGADVVASMKAEAETYVREVMASDNATLTALYTGSFSYVDSKTAELYGLDERPSEMTRVDLPSDERFGVFTQPAALAAIRGSIPRGLIIRESFLCEEIPLPPPTDGDLNSQLPETPADATEAERWKVFVDERPACASCHQTFQPLGLAFERYDNQGRYREENEHGRWIDPAGKLAGAVGWSGQFNDAREIVDEIVESRIGRDCFAQRYLTYVLGREIRGAESSCLTREVGHFFGEDGLNLHALIGAVAADQSTVTRFD